MSFQYPSGLAAFLILTLASVLQSGRAAENSAKESYETPPALSTRDVLSTDIRQSDSYTIGDDVTAPDFFYHFKLDSHFGAYDVTSFDQLKVRTHEVKVLATAVDAKGEIEFAKAIGANIGGTLKSAGQTIANPVKTAKAVAIEIQYKTLDAYDFVRRKNRYQPKESFIIGEEKRKLACSLDLDVYSTNPAVQQLLTREAKVRTAGSTLVDAGMSAAGFVIPVIGSMNIAISAVKYREKIECQIAALSPMELYRYNDKLLKDMGVHSSQREKFLEYAGLTPRQKTEIVADLKELKDLKEKTDFLKAAEEEHSGAGVWQVECAEMLAKYNHENDAIKSVKADGVALIAETVTGKRLIVIPADLLYWNADAEKAFAPASTAGTEGATGTVKTAKTAVAAKAAESDSVAKECILSGHLTKRAIREIQNRGYLLRENFLNPEPPEPGEPAGPPLKFNHTARATA